MEGVRSHRLRNIDRHSIYLVALFVSQVIACFECYQPGLQSVKPAWAVRPGTQKKKKCGAVSYFSVSFWIGLLVFSCFSLGQGDLELKKFILPRCAKIISIWCCTQPLRYHLYRWSLRQGFMSLRNQLRSSCSCGKHCSDQSFITPTFCLILHCSPGWAWSFCAPASATSDARTTDAVRCVLYSPLFAFLWIQFKLHLFMYKAISNQRV